MAKSNGEYLDPTAYQSDQGITDLQSKINAGNFKFGDASDKAAVAIKQYNAIYGRNPTTQELNYALSLSGGDINGYIAGQKYTEDNSPDKLAAKQQADLQAKAPEHYDQVKQMFQSQLGRAPTQDELDHFGGLLATGTVDNYGLQNFIQQQPEYQANKNKDFQNQLSDQLSGYDKQYFSNSILPSIQEAYAKQGRSFDSSSFQAATANAAQQQNTQRQQFLGNLTAQQYGDQQANAYNQYAAQLSQQQQLTNSGIQSQYGFAQNAINRQNQMNDFNTQQGAYNQYLAKYGQRQNNGIGSAIGGGVGAVAGAYYGGPAGASAGYTAGSGLGNAAQNYFGRGSY